MPAVPGVKTSVAVATSGAPNGEDPSDRPFPNKETATNGDPIGGEMIGVSSSSGSGGAIIGSLSGSKLSSVGGSKGLIGR